VCELLKQFFFLQHLLLRSGFLFLKVFTVFIAQCQLRLTFKKKFKYIFKKSESLEIYLNFMRFYSMIGRILFVLIMQYTGLRIMCCFVCIIIIIYYLVYVVCLTCSLRNGLKFSQIVKLPEVCVINLLLV